MPLAVEGGSDSGGGWHGLQMTWQSKCFKRKHGPPLGLRNLGNTCYLNSVLQCLTYTPPLANFCVKYRHSSVCDSGPEKENKGDCPFCILEKRIARSLNSAAVADAPLQINSCLRIFAEHFCIGRQEDAHEFLRYVIDACHSTCLRLKKLRQQHWGRNGVENGSDVNGTGETVVKDIFGGALQSQVKCLSCGAESNKVDEIMDISLDIWHSRSLAEALKNYFEPEILDGNNKYKCDSCKKLVAAKKQMSILQAPNILVIQLKRFEGIYGGKIDKAITFEEMLVLSSNMTKESQDLYPEYSLFGTIVHSGSSPDSGHYYAYIKDTNGRWYCCNDSYVTASTLQEVLSENVYVLFFSRTKQRPRGVVDAAATRGLTYESNDNKTSKIQTSVSLENSGKDHISETNISSKILHSNGSGLGILKSAGLEKVHGRTPNQFKKNNSNYCIASKDSQIPSPQIRVHDETSPSLNNLTINHSERRVTATANGSNFSEPSTEKSVASVNVKASSNLQSLASVSIQQRESGNKVHSTKLFAHENIKFSIRKKVPKLKNCFKEASMTSVENEKPNLSVGGKGLVTKDTPDVQIPNKRQCSTGSSGVQNGTFSVHSCKKGSDGADGSISVASLRNDNHKDLQNGNITGSASDLGRKRKSEDTPCIFLARDDQSQAKLHACKEMMEREASSVLRSCGWYNEVENLMRARKKLLREPGSSEMTNDEIKSELVSDAKKSCLSKVPESLKSNLIDVLRRFSEEQQSSKA